jgi:hypothetical protein|tara:strand:+ start:909 stop:1223 length:315 start_codon:yes stop_codon:yes gene_type:complete
MKYATGRKSLAICDRCGQRYRYLKLRKEWTGLKTCPDCFEPKHPQLEPSSPPFEPQVLHEPRIDVKEDNIPFTVYTNVGLGLIGTKLTSFQATGSVGTVTVSTS